MATADAKARISEFFSLKANQSTLDFVDVPIGCDLPVFLDPSRLRAMDTSWSSECVSTLQHYFQCLLENIVKGDKPTGLKILSGLSESNVFHLGLSNGISMGTGIGPEFSDDLWNSLSSSKAGKTGLLKDLEDACLFIEGVGPDRISDAVCNILRGPLIQYTQDMCVYYDIPITPRVAAGSIWNTKTNTWEDSLVDLPITPFGPLIFIPKITVRHRLIYDAQSYYTHYLLPEMQLYEKSINSALVYTLKDGRKRVTKKSLKGKYGTSKAIIADKSLQHTAALNKYRSESIKSSLPMTHDQFASIEKIQAPNFNQLLETVIKLPTGKNSATAYENAIEQLLSALFFPALSFPQKQQEIHNGRKRIDIRYVNTAQSGFFNWLSMHYPAPHIFIECKNYGKEIGNPEFDQLAGRFSPSRGKVGLLICRSVENESLMEARCRDAAIDKRGFILSITDKDLKILVEQHIKSNGDCNFSHLREKFNKLIM